ncbi:MAG: GNAT family N-acetyltransferase [Methyloligella sp. ZOD6]
MGYEIRTMPFEEVETTIDWAAREGWNPGLHDAECFYAIDPDGFFMGVLDGRVIARAAVLNYDENYAFGGLYIVDPEFRAHGYGMQLVEAMLGHAGDRNIGIDGVVEMQEKYKRLGYSFAHRDIRFSHVIEREAPVPEQVVPISDVPVETLAAYDRKHLPAPRKPFLKCWIGQANATGLAFVEEGDPKGYGVIRKCREGYKIGPLFADTPDIAEALYDALSNVAKGEIILLDIPDANTAGMKMAAKRRMVQVFECARMYLKGDPGLPMDRIFGLTSLEAG